MSCLDIMIQKKAWKKKYISIGLLSWDEITEKSSLCGRWSVKKPQMAM
jgi:hypothetical protein